MQYTFAGRFPFGHRRIKACCQLPTLSQAAASFIASDRQGIHRVRLFSLTISPQVASGRYAYQRNEYDLITSSIKMRLRHLAPQPRTRCARLTSQTLCFDLSPIFERTCPGHSAQAFQSVRAEHSEWWVWEDLEPPASPLSGCAVQPPELQTQSVFKRWWVWLNRINDPCLIIKTVLN